MSYMSSLEEYDFEFDIPENAISFVVYNVTKEIETLRISEYLQYGGYGIYIDTTTGPEISRGYESSPGVYGGEYFNFILDDITKYQSGDLVNLYFEIDDTLTADKAHYKLHNQKQYLSFNSDNVIDVSKLNPILNEQYIDFPVGAVDLVISDNDTEYFRWSTSAIQTSGYDFSSYDRLYISTNSYEFYVDAVKEDNANPLMLVSFEEGLFAYGVIESNPITQFYISFELDNEPIIEPTTIPVDIDNLPTEAQIRSQLTALDDVDGDISNLITYQGGTYETARTSNSIVIDTPYTINYQVTDSSNNVTTTTVTVIAKDTTKPTFGITNLLIEIPFENPPVFDETDLFDDLLVSDNYDSVEDITIEVISSEYYPEQGYGEEHQYDIVYRASDSSGNYRDITITVMVVDVDAPEFSGPTSFIVPMNKKTPISVILKNARSYAVDYFDNIDLTLQVISDNYTSATTPGIKTAVLRYSDLSGNYLDVTITINLVDIEAPIMFATPDLLIATDIYNTLTIEQIIEFLRRSEDIISYEVLTNLYSGNETTLGTYAITLSVTDSDNNVKQINPSILVGNSEEIYHHVYFETNGGTPINAKIVPDLSKLVVTNPTRAGYTFIGWYKDEALSQPFSLVSDSITFDITLYAKWTPTTSGGSTIIDNISNFKAADFYLIFGAFAVVLFVGYQIKKKK
ncbi:MAG: InlB B-repeat-containing protein [Acholeplasma sp.]|nr:InlB B-repeat-containing protein [Acholeplasma sp.]